MHLALRPVRRVRLSPIIGAALGSLLALGGVAVGTQACASAPGAWNESSRYPEKKRPEPARSASDGEVLGANKQDPADTLEASPTNEHPATGWGEEPGTGSHGHDAERNAEACREQARQAKNGARPAAQAAGQKVNVLCPPAPGK
jgi:hypothetical protein